MNTLSIVFVQTYIWVVQNLIFIAHQYVSLLFFYQWLMSNDSYDKIQFILENICLKNVPDKCCHGGSLNLSGTTLRMYNFNWNSMWSQHVQTLCAWSVKCERLLIQRDTKKRDVVCASILNNSFRLRKMSFCWTYDETWVLPRIQEARYTTRTYTQFVFFNSYFGRYYIGKYTTLRKSTISVSLIYKSMVDKSVLI